LARLAGSPYGLQFGAIAGPAAPAQRKRDDETTTIFSEAWGGCSSRLAVRAEPRKGWRRAELVEHRRDVAS